MIFSVPPVKLCSYGDNRPAIARGLCKPCYLRDWRKGVLPERGVSALPTVEHRILIAEEHSAALKKLATASGKSFSEIAREALERYVSTLKGG